MEDNEKEELEVLKRNFNLVVSVDYQMSKLVPQWGLSPQPGSTYYLQKLSHDIFGVVNHATTKSTVYLFDEQVGPKNTDHTVSYVSHFIAELPPWVLSSSSIPRQHLQYEQKLVYNGVGI